jgi:predicted DNA-binding transcriptional regulator AlpA
MAGSGGSNQVLSLEETAERLGIKPTTLYKHWREWTEQRGFKVGNLVRFRERNVEAYIDQLEQRQARSAREPLGAVCAHPCTPRVRLARLLKRRARLSWPRWGRVHCERTAAI